MWHAKTASCPQRACKNAPYFPVSFRPSFAGTFIHDARGGLSTAKVYSLIMFQYKDPQGKIQTASDWNLLDSYGIPWSKVSTLAAYRLSSEKLTSTGNR